MINNSWAKDNGAYTQYQQKQTQHHTYVPDSFDPSDGEWTNTEILLCAFTFVIALLLVWRAFAKSGDKS